MSHGPFVLHPPSVLVLPSVPLSGVGTLQEVQVPIISQSSCQEMYRTDPTEQVDILYDMICAGYQEGGKDSCQVLLDQLLVLHSQIHTCLHEQNKNPHLKITWIATFLQSSTVQFLRPCL